ncbi:hypothetical protein [Halomonas sp. C05BenzN]|uniref:hypothetical protein n=1 Tax=Halomonas sp. C05BenzN TaxID=3411041 RepID=UPI003B93150F
MNNRDDFIERMKANLDAWNAEIERLAARAREAGEEARVRYHDDIERLKQRRDETRELLEELEQTGEAAWGTLRQGVEESWQRLRKAFDDAASHFR